MAAANCTPSCGCTPIGCSRASQRPTQLLLLAAALSAQAQEAVTAVAQREKELEREVEEATREVSS